MDADAIRSKIAGLNERIRSARDACHAVVMREEALRLQLQAMCVHVVKHEPERPAWSVIRCDACGRAMEN